MYWQESLTHLMNVKMPDRQVSRTLQMSRLVGKTNNVVYEQV